MTDKKPAPRRKRARTSDGQFKANDPKSPVNEAWEPEAIEPAKEVDYSIKPKVNPTSSAGKYDKTSKPKVRPRQGVRTIEY